MTPLIALLLAQIAGLPGQIQTPNAGRWVSTQGTYQCTGTGCVSRPIASKLGDVISAADFSGVDACAQINAAITSLAANPTGGTIDATMFTGTQACASNPVAQTGNASNKPKPFTLKLGCAIYQVAVPWVYGEGGDAYHTGQLIEGGGVECTTLQPTASFSGAAVIQIKPPSPDVLVRQTSFRDLTIDMNNVSNKTAIEILSGSNLPVFSNITVIRQDGRFLHIAPQDTSSAIPEGIIFSGWYFYAKTPKVANGVEIGNANEITFRDGKLLGAGSGTSPDKNFVGFLLWSELVPGAPINSATEGVHMTASSVDNYDTGIKLTSNGTWASPQNNQFIATTLENLNVGIYLAGKDINNQTSGNQIIATRYLSTVVVHLKFDWASGNLVEEAEINGAGTGSYVFTANSSNNLVLRQFSRTNKDDVSDSGAGNEHLGWINNGGLSIGAGGSGSSNTKVQIDSGATGNPLLQFVRNQVAKVNLQVSDSSGTDEFVITNNGHNWRFNTAGTLFTEAQSLSGKLTTYNNITTAGIGVAAVYGTPVLLTAQTADKAATNVYASAPVGEYRVCATARTTTSGTGTTATLNIIWTDEGGVKTDAVGTWALNSVTVTGQINKCEFIHAAASTNIQVSTSGGTYGTSVYALSATAERLN